MKKLTASIFSAVLMLSMVFSSSVFAANDATSTKASAWESFLGLFSKTTATTATANVEYRGHVQDYGDVPTNGTWVQEDNQLGTTGESKRIEGFKIELTDGNTLPAGTQIRYNVHIENEGWQNDPTDIVNTNNWVKDGAFAGSVAKSQRVEAIEIVLTDANGVKLEGYSVQYMVHGENYGWSQGWVADGAIAGTEHQSLRLEAIRIKITQLKADLTAYNAALAAVNQADYTTASWTTYQAVVNANKVTEDNSQAAVDTATANIKAAQGNLVLIPKVASVTALNAKQIQVTYNTEMAVASAANKANYTLTNNSTAATNAPTLAELSADKKVVTLTLTNALTNYDVNFTLGISSVLSTTGSEIKDFNAVYVLADKVRPVVGELVWDDSETISFTIDKDINSSNLSNFVGVYDANGIKQVATPSYVTANNQSKVAITVAGLTPANYSVRVVGLADLAGNLINPNPTEKTFTVSKDVTAPTVVSVTPIGFASSNATFSVTFSEKLQAAPSIDIDNVATAVTPSVSADGKTYTLTTTTGTMTTGLHSVTVKNFKDLAGNAGTAVAKTVTFGTSTPQLVSATYTATTTGNKVIVKFDRDIAQGASFTDLTSGSWTNSNVYYEFNPSLVGHKIASGAITINDIDKDGIQELVIDADNYTASTPSVMALPTGSYTVQIPAGEVKDAATQANKQLNISFVVPSGTTAQTTVKTVQQQVDVNYVNVEFSGKVADASALTLSNYTVEGAQIFTNAVFTDSDKDTVRLTVGAGTIQADSDYTFAVNNIVDINGRSVKAYSEAKTLSENVKPYIAAAEINAVNNVKVTFNEALIGSIGAVSDGKVEVYVNGSKITPTNFSLSGAVLNITVPAFTTTTSTVVVKTTDAFDLKDANNNIGATNSEKTAVWNIVADTAAPTITSAQFTDATHVTVVFDEAVNAVKGDFTGGVIATPTGTFTVDSLTGNGTNTVVLAVTGSATITGTTTGTVDVAATVVDLAGNPLVAVNDRAITAGGF